MEIPGLSQTGPEKVTGEKCWAEQPCSQHGHGGGDADDRHRGQVCAGRH